MLATPMPRNNPPLVLDMVLRHARALERAQPPMDKQRMCFLVTDAEWDQLVNYQNDIRYTDGSDNPDGMVSMSVLGMDIVKRSAITRQFYEE
jgi:hypothetical protein